MADQPEPDERREDASPAPVLSAAALRLQLEKDEAPLRLKINRTLRGSGPFEIAEAHVNRVPVRVKRFGHGDDFGGGLGVFIHQNYLEDVDNYHNRDYALLESRDQALEQLSKLYAPPRDSGQAQEALRRVRTGLLAEESKIPTNGLWNYEAIGLYGLHHEGGHARLDPEALTAYFRGGGEPPPGDLCLLTPQWPGRPLAAYPPDDQRRLFPKLLASLWAAVRSTPHRSLSADKILLDPGEAFFRLLDPGVSLSLRYEDEEVMRDAVIFTTEPANYPLVAPHLDWHIGRGWAGLRHHLGHQMVHEEELQLFLTSQIHDKTDIEIDTRRSCQDTIAIGCLYLRLLTGRTLPEIQPFEGLEFPLWQHATSLWVEFILVPLQCRDPARRDFLDWLEHQFEDALVREYSVHREEAELCGQLIRNEIGDRSTLIQRAIAVLKRFE